MKFDEFGFIYPVVDKAICIDCHNCEKSCPYYNLDNWPKQIDDNYPPIYACYNKDENIRILSTSGGIFSILAQYILSNKGIVFAVRFDERFRIIHAKTEDYNEIQSFRGSKYAQSDIGLIYREIKDYLNNNRHVLFVGTPCQVAGLKQFLNKEYEQLYTCDFICMGIASSKIWEDYLDQFENIKDIKSIIFKDKRIGWHDWKLKFIYKTKEKYYNRFSNLFMNGYLNWLYFRPSCYECPFKGFHRVSDFTVSDCWGIEKIYPQFDDNKGTSCLMLHTEKSKKVFEIVKTNLIFMNLTKNDVRQHNKYSCESAPRNINTEIFYIDLKKNGFRHAMLKFCRNKELKTTLSRVVKKIYHICNKEKA
jgi:coenzyme F420-reducing hydrogenase beta subunit